MMKTDVGVRFKVGDIVRVAHPRAELNFVYHNRIAKIVRISDGGRWMCFLKFFNINVQGLVAMYQDELEKIPDREAWLWLI